VLLVSGLHAPATLTRAMVRRFSGAHRVAAGPVLRRWSASLDGGFDAFLARRSPRFRANLRRAERRAAAAGVVFESADDGPPDAVVARAAAVESTSWKGGEGTGLLAPDMRCFYDAIARRLAPAGRLRATFARAGGDDVGYILGGVRDGLYRGLQMSFDDTRAELSLGSLLQARQIAALCDEGATSYDLGMDMRDKRRWAEHAFDTITIAISPGP
jgi:CelD/BcsL family acetyltransferase involved in cellulose biosynthesis